MIHEHMFHGTNSKTLNGTHAFPMANVLTLLPALGGGSVDKYAWLKECDAFMMNAFRIGPLSPNQTTSPYASTLHPQTHMLTNTNANRYANEVQSHVMKRPLSKDLKTN